MYALLVYAARNTSLQWFTDKEFRPDGEWKSEEGSRNLYWYPSETEKRACCEGLKNHPDYPGAVYNHCRSLKHVAHMLRVPTSLLRREKKCIVEMFGSLDDFLETLKDRIRIDLASHMKEDEKLD